MSSGQSMVCQTYLGTPPPNKVYVWETLEPFVCNLITFSCFNFTDTCQEALQVERDYRLGCHEFKLFDGKHLHVWTMLYRRTIAAFLKLLQNDNHITQTS